MLCDLARAQVPKSAFRKWVLAAAAQDSASPVVQRRMNKGDSVVPLRSVPRDTLPPSLGALLTMLGESA